MPEPTLPTPSPAAPLLANLETRLRSLRGDLDRIDDVVGQLDSGDRLGLESWAGVLRSVVEGFEDEIDRRAAAAGYADAIRAWIIPHVGLVPLSKMTAKLLLDLYRTLREKGSRCRRCDGVGTSPTSRRAPSARLRRYR